MYRSVDTQLQSYGSRLISEESIVSLPPSLAIFNFYDQNFIIFVNRSIALFFDYLSS